LKSKFISLILSVAVIAGLMLVPAALPAVPAGVALASGNVTISIQPPLKKVGFNETFNITVMLANPSAMPIGNADVRLRFDPTYFNVTNMVNGDMPFNFGQSWDNVTGIIKSGPYMASGTNTTATSILLCTIACKSKDASGESTVNFLYEAGPPPLKTVVIYGATDYLESGNMALMYNGTVKAGKATLTIAAGNETVLDVTFPGQPTGKRYQRIVGLDMPNFTATARAMFYPPAERTGFGFPVKVLYADVVVDLVTQDMSAQVVNILVNMGGGFEPATLVKNYVYTGAHGVPYAVGKNWSYNTTLYLPDLDVWSNGTFYANVTEEVPLALSNYGVPIGSIPCFHIVHTDQPAGAGNVTYEAWFADPLYAPGLGFVKMVDPSTWTMPDTSPASETSLLSGISIEGTGKVEITSPAMGQVAPPYPNMTQWAWDTPVTLKATATAPGWAFDHWSGNLLGPTNPNTITMSVDQVVFPNFKQLPPVLGYSPASFTGANKFSCRKGMENPENQTLDIWNSGGYTLGWSLSDDATWLNENLTAGSLTTGQHDYVLVSVEALSPELDVGTYYANITITTAGGPVNVPVELEVKEATTISVVRDLPGNNLLPDETYPGDQFTVYVNFTSPTDDFNAISLVDQAPAGWRVDTDTTWCSPTPADEAVNRSTNVVEITWHGVYAKGTKFSAVYKVTVPNTAAPGINLFPLDNCALAWVGYHFGAEPPMGQYQSCISSPSDYKMLITVPGKVWGETRDVNARLLDTVLVTLSEEPAGTPPDINPEDTCSSAQPNAVYSNDVDDTGNYWQRAQKWCYYTLDMNTMPGSRNPNYPLLINLTTPELLAAGFNIDFEGDYGLVPRACNVTYAMESVNKCNFVPKDTLGGNHTEWRLTSWKAMESVNSWTNPQNCV